jgi:hypothetical protein
VAPFHDVINIAKPFLLVHCPFLVMTIP